MSEGRVECVVQIYAEAVDATDSFEVVFNTVVEESERKLFFTPTKALEVAQMLMDAAVEATKRNCEEGK